MIIIFGWLKEKRPVKAALQCYCYSCHRKSDWMVLRETEWVTFFAVKAIPFLSKESLACERCGHEMAITKAEARSLLAGEAALKIVQRLEDMQLANKSEVQRNFLLSARAARDSDSGSV